MSIVTGRRLNRFCKKLSKSLKEKIDKRLENVLYSTETDEHIFSASKSGFVPKTERKYDKEFRYLRADGQWSDPGFNSVIANRQHYNIDAQNAAVTEDISIRLEDDIYYGGILLINVNKLSNVGSAIGASTSLLASYAYSVVLDDVLDANDDYTYKEVVKIAALSSGLSGTYGTISAVNQSNNESYGVVRIKVNKGYGMSIKLIS